MNKYNKGTRYRVTATWQGCNDVGIQVGTVLEYLEPERGVPNWHRLQMGDFLRRIINATSEQIDTCMVSDAFSRIRPGSTVTMVDSRGSRRTGRAVMFNRAQNLWVLNLGGAHGTPGLASPDNTVKLGR